MHVDPERFRPQIANWFNNNPEYTHIATDDFGDPRWFNELIISIYPCPPSEKINGIIRQIAQEVLASGNPATLAGLGQFESKLGSKLAMLEAVQNPEFAADDLGDQLQDVHVDEMTGDGKVILRFKSKPLQPSDRTKITKDAWFTVSDFTKDFPGEFEKISATVQDAFNRAAPVRVSSQTEIGQRETLADFKGAYINFGGAALAGDDLDEGPATGRLRVHVFVEVLVPLEEVGEVPEPVGAEVSEIPGEFS